MAKKVIVALAVFSLLILFFLFYYIYVPLVTDFQLVFAPILAAIFVVTLINCEWGLFFFVFTFPLINNLPYFFGIYEHIPHSPTALVLFLAFFIGWALKRWIRPTAVLKPEISKPLLLISLMIAASGILTFLRYSNYFPIVADSIYEFTVNVEGTTSGGAFMSTLFSSLNYLTGFAFFFILVNTIKSKDFIKKILIILSVSTSVSIMFGMYQHFIQLSFGNLPSRIVRSGISVVNATFKDGNSFGAYLSFFIPLALGFLFLTKGLKKIFFLISIIPALFLLPQSASISSVVATFISLLFFFWFYEKSRTPDLESKRTFFKKITGAKTVLIFILLILISGIFLIKDSSTFNKLKSRIDYWQKRDDPSRLTGHKFSYFWPIAGNMMKDFPVSGVGIGAYIIEASNYGKRMNKTIRRSDSAENYLLHIGAELGVLGLFVFFWIFWEIFKQTRRCFRTYLPDKKWRFAVIGITGGLVSLLINYIFHSYIGSFEIKYTFWLLIGIIFALNQIGQTSKMRLKIGKNTRIVYLMVFLLFTATLAYNSIQSLSLGKKATQLGLEHDFGFYEEEHDGIRAFRWTRRTAGFSTIINGSVFKLQILASHPDIEENPVHVEFLIIKDFFEKKINLGHISIRDNNWNTYSFKIPQGLLNDQIIMIIKTDRTWQPQKELGTPDPRKLGIAVRDIKFELPQL